MKRACSQFMLAICGLCVALVGCTAVLFSYLALAKSRGVFRFSAYDRLSSTDNSVWVAG